LKKFYLWLHLNNKQSGTTLIEIIVVIAVLTILVSLATPGFNFLRKQSTLAELDKLHIVCNLLQKQAVSSQHKQYFILDSKYNSYFYCNHSEKLPSNILFNFIDGAKGPPANPKKMIHHAITFKNNKITFHKNGTISAGTLYLTDKNKQNMYALTIPVSQVSFIRKYKYKKNKWIYL
jgi:prepilin-type N-terminal cleavage/methylation domain-containing protein